MFEANEEIGAAVEILYGIAAKLNRGDVLTHSEIEAVLGVRPHEGSWDHIVGRVRRQLLTEKGIATWPENTVGYKLATIKEQLHDIPMRRMKKGSRQLRRGKREVESLPDKGLSLNDRRVRAAKIESIRSAQAQMRQEMRTQSVLARPTPTLPRQRIHERLKESTAGARA